MLAVPPTIPANPSSTKLRNSTTLITFSIINAFPKVTLNNIQWTYTNYQNISEVLNISCTDCYPRYTFSEDLLTLNITNLQVSDYGDYTLQVSNPAGVRSATHRLTVHGVFLLN